MATERVILNVPSIEHSEWAKEAKHLGMPLESWVRRAVRIALRTEIEGTVAVTGRPERLSSQVMKCEWCGGSLRTTTPTVRRRFCSDICRVESWRAKRAQLPR
jgi:hypothetical protein